MATAVDGTVSKWIGRVVAMIDGCDNWKRHPDGSPHTRCVTARYKVRIIEFDCEWFWGRLA